jgi:hypothetical protein
MQAIMLPVLLASLLLMPLAATHVNACESGKHSCPKKISGPEPDSMPLPPRALARLDARGGFGYGILSGTLHNANPDYIVTQVTVFIAPAGKQSMASEASREYNLPMALKPNSTGSLSMLLPSDHIQEYSWKITKACGYKVG